MPYTFTELSTLQLASEIISFMETFFPERHTLRVEEL